MAGIKTRPGQAVLSLVQERLLPLDAPQQDTAIDDSRVFLAYRTSRRQNLHQAFQAGNPRPLIERWTVPIKPSRRPIRGYASHIDLLDELSSVFAASSPFVAAAVPGGLPATLLPQNRWVAASFGEVRSWLEARLVPDNRVKIRSVVARPKDTLGLFVHLIEETGDEGPFVRIGSCESAGGVLLQRLQSANPRTLRIRRLWRVTPRNRIALRQIGTHIRIETAAAALCPMFGAWLRLEPAAAIAAADLAARRHRLECVFSS